ncbi:MAG: formylglycine-generating enzyme family protein, partial [Alphaproteobacteria bacterium]|nr:formylglycine-generating enzyme family protein [Alphaproteobacteria bacterium]
GCVFRDRAADGSAGLVLPEMVVVPAGQFMMGSESSGSKEERQAHPVTFARPFAVGRYAVTFDEWDAFVAAGGSKHRPGDRGWGRGRRPVINVSWDDAKSYVAWLSQVTGKQYRLLSEAEWEYAARGGSDEEVHGKGNANCNGCGSKWDNKQTAPVGSFKPNAYGLFEMLGNVWEWTEDAWHDSYKGAPNDGRAWVEEKALSRVRRGGSWGYNPGNVRSAIRSRLDPEFRNSVVGFRVARTL